MKHNYMSKAYKIAQNTCKLFIISTVVLVTVSILVQIFYIDNKGRILNEFSNNLFQYPLPPNTVIVETRKFDGKSFLGGNGGYWNVGASMTLATKLTKEDVLNYYKHVKFPYPKNSELGEKPEIYFEDDIQKKEYRGIYGEKGFYYVHKRGRTCGVPYYFENDEIINIDKMSENNGQDLVYVIQILGSYDYFLKLD